MKIEHVAHFSFHGKDGRIVGDRKIIPADRHDDLLGKAYEFARESGLEMRVCVPRESSPSDIGGCKTVPVDEYLEWMTARYENRTPLPDWFDTLETARDTRPGINQGVGDRKPTRTSELLAKVLGNGAASPPKKEPVPAEESGDQEPV